MITDCNLIRPQTLEHGEKYIWVEKGGNGQESRIIRVRFICYDPCPAFVIVTLGHDEKRRCARDELFALPG